VTPLQAAPEFTAVHSDAQITCVAQLARDIWPEHYPGIISQAQIDYMLASFQSESAITAQLQDGYEYFLVSQAGSWLGYCSVRTELELRRLFVSKLYLLKAVRGQGMGRATMNFLARLAALRGLATLWLTVNKHNSALQAYLHMGWVVTNEVVTDIGNGYVMDDYQLQWTPAIS
jgi:GNAT superfamily N-acetyltransferase